MKANLFFAFGLLCILLASCSTSQKIVLRGTPGTTITTPDNKTLGVIGNSGEIELEIFTKDNFTPFLFSQSPTSSQRIPFALDYKNNNKNAVSSTLEYTGYTLGLTCLIPAIVGFALMDSDEPSLTSTVLGCGGFVGAFVGTFGMALPGFCLNQNSTYKYSYSYLKEQQTNDDLLVE